MAPSEIKADVTVLADGFETLLGSLQSGQPDTSVILDPRFQAAATNLNAYAQQVCGITGAAADRSPAIRLAAGRP